jgi:hypothetical protein
VSPRRQRRHPLDLSGLTLAGLVVLFWAVRVAWPGRELTLPSTDLWVYFYPTYRAAYDWLAAGTLPLWNPYLLCGLPWLGTVQGGFFYPPHVLYLVLPTHLGLAASAVLHLVFIALCTAAFARRVSATAAAGVLAGMLFTLRGMIPHWLLWPSMIEAAAWLPLGALATLEIGRRTSGRAAGVLALSTGASLLAGYPQVTIYLVYGWAALLAGVLVARRAPPVRWIAAASLFAAALLLGTLAGAVQLLPGLELAQAGTRAAHVLTPGEMYTTVGTGDLTETVLPGTQFSFGVLGSSLLPAALWWPRRRGVVLGALLFGLLTFAFALGPATRLFDLYRSLPALGWFRLPSRILLLTDFCFAILAAIAFDALVGVRAATPDGEAPAASGRGMARAGALIALAVVLATTVRFYGAGRTTYVAGLVSTVIAAALVLGAGGTTRWRARLAAGALLVTATLELFAAPPASLPFPYTSRAATLFAKHAQAFADLAARVGSDRVWMYSDLPRLEFAPTLPSYYRLRAMDTYEPANLRRQAEYFTYLIEGSVQRTRPPWLFLGRAVPLSAAGTRPGAASRRRLIDLAAVRFLTTGVLHRGGREFADRAGLEEVAPPDPGLALYRNPHALPRAFVAYRALRAPPPEVLLGLISQADFDPLAVSYVEGDSGIVAGPDAPAHGHAATFVRDEERVVEVEATLAAPGLVVLADTFYPGWRATVDGASARILATNHMFRGVPVPAGRHRVRFEYLPSSAIAGAAASIVGGVGVLALLVIVRERPGSPAARS